MAEAVLPETSQASAPAPRPQAVRPEPAPTHQGGSHRFLTGRTLLEFGRCHNDYEIVDVNVQIENQDTLSGMTYDQIVQICALEVEKNYTS